MPPYGPMPMPQLANVTFLTCNRKVPHAYLMPMSSPDRDHLLLAFWNEPEDLLGGTPQMLASPKQVAGAATPLKIHGEGAKEVSKWHMDFMKDACDAIKNSVNSWSAKVKFKDIKIAALLGGSGPGVMDAPELKNEPAMKSFVSSAKEDNAKAYNKAVSEGVSKNWKEWSDNVMCNLPLWPMFIVFPGPQGPPMPGLPLPLIAWLSPKMTKITVPSELKTAMVDALDQGVKDEDEPKDHECLFNAIGTATATAALAWLPSTMVVALLGKGPIPTFAPPPAPVGPVTMGEVLGTPGHLP